ncbi:hypothetical protein [Anaeromusa acidaminophila]|nr:hypothetical protein [Anaeromusa acidaminophila]
MSEGKPRFCCSSGECCSPAQESKQVISIFSTWTLACVSAAKERSKR